MPDRLIRTDARFWVLSEALASYAGDPDDPPIREGEQLQAAVSVVIRARRPWEFLLIKRAESERDPWSGHMALPGGRWDPTDAGLVDTARRETLEETGVDLAAHGVELGRLDDVSPSSQRIPALTIAAFVFGVPAHTEAFVASSEVAEVYWVSLEALRNPANRADVEIPLPGGPRSFPSYSLMGEHVWGLTHRILEGFLARYPDSALELLEREGVGPAD